MSVPNLRHIVQAVRESRAWDFTTEAGLCAYSDAVVMALHRHDPNFRHLKKRKPQNGCYPEGSIHGRSVDAALYVPTGQAIDFIIHAEPGSANAVSWGTSDPVGKYAEADGFIPDLGTNVPNPGPILPPPVEPPDPRPIPPADLGLLLERIDRVTTSTVALSGVVDALAVEIRALAAKPAPVYTGRLFGTAVTLRPQGE